MSTERFNMEHKSRFKEHEIIVGEWYVGDNNDCKRIRFSYKDVDMNFCFDKDDYSNQHLIVFACTIIDEFGVKDGWKVNDKFSDFEFIRTYFKYIIENGNVYDSETKVKLEDETQKYKELSEWIKSRYPSFLYIS